MNLMPIRQFGKKPEKNMSEAPLVITKGGKKAYIIFPYSTFAEAGTIVSPIPQEPLLTKDEIWYNKPMFTNRFKVLVSIIFLFAALSLFTLALLIINDEAKTSLLFSKQAYINSVQTLKIVKSFPTTAPTATPEAVLKAPVKSTNFIIKTPTK